MAADPIIEQPSTLLTLWVPIGLILLGLVLALVLYAALAGPGSRTGLETVRRAGWLVDNMRRADTARREAWGGEPFGSLLNPGGDGRADESTVGGE